MGMYPASVSSVISPASMRHSSIVIDSVDAISIDLQECRGCMIRIRFCEILLHMGLCNVLTGKFPAFPFFEEMNGITGYAGNQFVAGAPVLFFIVGIIF